jgi:hypothetical protein
MSNILDTEVSMSGLSYQEKSLYGTLVAELAVFVPYLVYEATHFATFSRLVETVFVLIVSQIVLQAAIAIATRNRLKDERDRIVELLGYKAGYFTLVGGVLFGLAALWAHVAAGRLYGDMNRLGSHFISVVFCLVMFAELVKTFVQLRAYRRAR